MLLEDAVQFRFIWLVPAAVAVRLAGAVGGCGTWAVTVKFAFLLNPP